MGAALKLERTQQPHAPPTPTLPSQTSSAPVVGLSGVLAGLSHALDLAEGQPPGHTIRTCVIGMRLGEALGLNSEDRSALYYALLLKDAGCSLTPGASVGRRKSILAGIRHFMSIVKSEDLTRELVALRSERGASIARRLGFPQATADAIRGSSGEDVSLLARICNISRTVDVFHSARGVDETMRVLRRRQGTWFDPSLVQIVLEWKNDRTWWRGLNTNGVTDWVVSLEPADQIVVADANRLDDVALAFADIIDAKSPYRFNHSIRVARASRFIAQQLGLSSDAHQCVYRAGLLHDIGKLGVSSLILNKAVVLDARERAEMEAHPRDTLSILSRVAMFSSIAKTASMHHERLDGSGYPWQLTAEQLDDEARLLAVADVYDALISDRPHRTGVPPAMAIDVLWADAGTRLSREAVEAIADWPSDE